MKNIIFYFTGTGNSLMIAKNLADKIGNCELVNIFSKEQISNFTSFDTIGIVFPIHIFGVPNDILDFFKNLKIEKDKYLFIVTNYGGEPIFSTKNLINILKRKIISVAFNEEIKMPVNYTPFFGSISKRAQDRLFEANEAKLTELAKIIMDKKTLRSIKHKFSPLNLLFPLFSIVRKRSQKMDKQFWVNEKCDGCEICMKVCPVNNITMVDSKPIWHNKCSQCFACLQWCPQQAIESGKKTEGRRRYHNPHITIDEIIINKKTT